MKNVYKKLLIATIGLLAITACSNDDDTNLPNPAPIPEANYILGGWKLNTLSIKSFENGELVYEEVDVPMQDAFQMEFNFTKDNTVEYLMAIPNTEIEEKGVGTYKKEGNKLTIVIEGDTQTMEILMLSNDDLHLKVVDEWEEDGVKFKDETEQKFIRK